MVNAQTIISSAYLELNNRGQVIRFNLDRPEHRLGRSPDWADLLVPSDGWQVISGRHAVLRRQGAHYVICDGDGVSQPSTNGTFVNHTLIKPNPGFALTQSTQMQIGQNPENAIALTYVAPQLPGSAVVPTKLRLDFKSITEFPVELGREPSNRYAALTLNAPMVSRHHATITRSGTQYVLNDQSTNGTFINKQRVSRSQALNDGDTIQIGPFVLLFRNQVLEIFDRGDQIRLDAKQLVRKVKDGGGEKTILSNVSLAIEPGQLVAIVGGSGAGKSTLMKTLLGIEPTTTGTVLLNGDPLRQNFDIYRREIGYVPQDDIIHDNLTVEEVLTYACQLRLPPDTNIPEAVKRTVEQVKLSHVRQTSVQRLSGGQRKRVSIAVELLANPKLFFLDEPTSGLDPGLDKKMMLLLRELANQGRTVILVTHATSNLTVCDRVAFMGSGGQLCYFGPPAEALPFFQGAPSTDVETFADIYIQLDSGDTDSQRQQNVQLWASKFQKSPDYHHYVQTVLSEGQQAGSKAPPTRRKAGILRQGMILGQRYLRLVLRDRFNLTLMLITAPIGVLLIMVAVRNYNVLARVEPLEFKQAPQALRVLFVFTCATLWVGLSSTAQAIVKESSIYLRERLVNLRLLSYIGSKLGIHAGLAVLQVVLVVAAIAIAFRTPTQSLMPWLLGCSITTFLTLIASVSLGLMVSACVKNSTQANSALPLLLIPQIVFSGILFNLEGASKVLSWLMLSRWSIGAYAALVDVNAMVPTQQAPPGVTLPPPPFEPSATYDPTWQNLMLNWAMLGVHSLVCLLVVLWQQRRKDIL
jgi:ABC-type multidrug transport system ATPase subunit